MSRLPQLGRELSSWKEIAAYLGVSVRTAQLWERERGLPVYRLPGARSQVRVLESQLEAWKQSRTTPAAAPIARSRRFGLVALLIVGALVLVAAVVRWPRTPAGYRVEHHALIVTDDGGRELWRHVFADLADEAYQREGKVWIGDLGDHRVTILFQEVPRSPGPSGPLIAYNADGSERWRFPPGRTVRTVTESFAPAFRVMHFLIAPLGRDRQHRIAVTSTHNTSFICQIALLDNNGKVLREYWHSGHLQHLLAADLNHQGWKSLFVAGISNARKTATLIELDPDHFTGASNEESPSYQLQDFARPVETARILFPRSRMNIALESFMDITSFRREGDDLVLEVQTA
jgi:excisionase family DNA binding protein